MTQDVLQAPEALKASTKRRPDGWALLTAAGTTADFRPRVRNFFGATLSDDEPKFDSDALARQDRENPGDAPHRCVEVFFSDGPATPAPVSRDKEVSATIEELGRPAFWGFEDHDACCVHMNFTPCGARAGGEYAKAYYSADQVRELLRQERVVAPEPLTVSALAQTKRLKAGPVLNALMACGLGSITLNQRLDVDALAALLEHLISRGEQKRLNAFSLGQSGSVTIGSYRIGAGRDALTVQCMEQRSGLDLWSVKDCLGNVLSKNGEWECEPQPSGRDDDFMARCRYATHTEAVEAALTAAEKRAEPV